MKKLLIQALALAAITIRLAMARRSPTGRIGIAWYHPKQTTNPFSSNMRGGAKRLPQKPGMDAAVLRWAKVGSASMKTHKSPAAIETLQSPDGRIGYPADRIRRDIVHRLARDPSSAKLGLWSSALGHPAKARLIRG